MRIIFMGTPEFAVPSLEILLEHGHQVVAVVTATDKLGGRGGKQLLQSAVKKFAVSKGLHILQPPNLKDPAFIEALRSLHADLQIVVAFRMLPEAVWAMPNIGTFNLHGSLLPKYRGAAPINWAIIEGEEETGVTTFFLQHEIDTGDIILQEKMPIGENETVGEVYEKLMQLGAATVLKTVDLIQQGNIKPSSQDPALATKAPKIFHETCELDFHQTTKRVHDFVRGLSPIPGAWTKWQLQGEETPTEVKIFRTEKETTPHTLPPGQIVTDKKSLKVSTLDGFVHVLELQLQGRKKMNTVDFINGLRGDRADGVV